MSRLTDLTTTDPRASGSTVPAKVSVRGGVALATAGLGAIWVSGYLFIIDRQGTEMDAPLTVCLATFVGVMATLALSAAFIRDRNVRWAQAMLYAAAGGFLPAGVLGLASIGFPLILAGLLAFAAIERRRIPLPLAAAAAVLTAFAFAVGVALTIRVS